LPMIYARTCGLESFHFDLLEMVLAEKRAQAACVHDMSRYFPPSEACSGERRAWRVIKTPPQQGFGDAYGALRKIDREGKIWHAEGV